MDDRIKNFWEVTNGFALYKVTLGNMIKKQTFESHDWDVMILNSEEGASTKFLRLENASVARRLDPR